MGSLDGKVALITGAGGMKGIGRATALKLAAQGADIVLSDVPRTSENLPPREVKKQWRSIDSVAEEVEALGRRCLKVWCDLTVPDQIYEMVRTAGAHYGHIDILVNNARAIIGRDRVLITELSDDLWREFLAINTTAVFLTTKLVGKMMVERGRGGRIVNIASEASKRPPGPMFTAYATTKFGVLGLTQSSALDLASHQITVNAVCPGLINTERMNYQEVAQAHAAGVPPEEYSAKRLANASKKILLGRPGEPEDVANLVAFLVSDEAGFITGQAYNINGGTVFH